MDGFRVSKRFMDYSRLCNVTICSLNERNTPVDLKDWISEQFGTSRTSQDMKNCSMFIKKDSNTFVVYIHIQNQHVTLLVYQLFRFVFFFNFLAYCTDVNDLSHPITYSFP